MGYARVTRNYVYSPIINVQSPEKIKFLTNPDSSLSIL